VQNVARIQYDCPFLVCSIKFDATLWSPRIGETLCKEFTFSQIFVNHHVAVGKVNLCSPDHIALLAHRTFNVSIPRHHIPTETWEFEYGPAENDPEFGREAQEGEEEAVESSSSGGRWIHKVTGQVLDGLLEFTVIG
jgi:DNA-directed RNA polymerase I subunit RPA43